MDTETLKSNHVVIVNIEGINGQGVGYGFVGSRKIFVDYTATGDTVEAKIDHVSSKYTKAQCLKILTPSDQRQQAPCPHFTVCGGCQLQHLTQQHYTALKEQWVHTAVARAGFETKNIAPLLEVGPHNRRRVVFKIKTDENKLMLGFFEESSHRLVDITECHIAKPLIIAFALKIKPYLNQLTCKNFLRELHVTYHEHDHTLDVIVCAEHELPPSDQNNLARAFQITHPKVRAHWLFNQRLTRILNHPITYLVGDATVDLPPLAFLQATEMAQERMIQEIFKALPKPSTVFDLYAGCGTFSFSLIHAGHAVTAIEGDQSMVEAMQQALSTVPLHQTGLLTTMRRDLYLSPIKASTLKNADAVVINPPRNGATPQLQEIAKANIPTVVMISCSLTSFERDARILNEAGYQLESLTPIDQFFWTRHTECVAHFSSNAV